MKIHIRFDETYASHTWMTVFVNGKSNGTLCMSPDEADWFYSVVEKGSKMFGIEFLGNGTHRLDAPIPPIPATPACSYVAASGEYKKEESK